VQILQGVAVEADVLRLLDQHLDRRLVVEDHLRLELILALGSLSELDQVLGVEQAVGIALQAAGGPGQVDQQAVEDLPRIGAGGLVLRERTTQPMQVFAGRLGEIGRAVADIALQQLAAIPHRLALCQRAPDQREYRRAVIGQRDFGIGERAVRCLCGRDPGGYRHRH